MRIIRRLLLLTVLLALLAGIPYLGYLLFLTLQRPVSDPQQAIPDKTALIIRINNPVQLLDELKQSNLIWKEVVSYPFIRPVKQKILLLDSITKARKEVREILTKYPLYMTLSVYGSGSFDLLFVTSMPATLNLADIGSLIQQEYPGKVTILPSPYAHTEILQAHFEGAQEPLYISAYQGVLLFSLQSDLVKRAIDRLSLNTPSLTMAGFKTIASTTGQKVDANIFIHLPYFSLALYKIGSEELRDRLVSFARFADWSGLDLLIQKDQLVLTGYTLAPDSALHILALESGQQPQPVSMLNELPGHTQSVILFTFSDYPKYFSRWNHQGQQGELSLSSSPPLEFLNNKYRAYIPGFFVPWIGNQIGRCDITPGGAEEKAFRMTVIQTRNSDSARVNLLKLSRLTGMKDDSVRYKGKTIFRATTTEFINAFLSPLLPPEPVNYFLIHKDLIFLTDDQSQLKWYIDQLDTHSLLTQSKAFVEVSENISDIANVFYFCKSGQAAGQIPLLLSENLRPYILPIADSLKKFQTVSVQLTNQDGMFYTHIVLRFNPSISEEGPMIWQAALDTLVSGSPQIIRDHLSGGSAVLVTDTNTFLYKFSQDGKLIWKQKLYGRILGTVHDITLNGQDSLFYIFNTENHLYMVRSDGVLADRFPMKFPVRATSGLALVDYDGSRNYRIIIAFRNKKIYNFNLSGEMVEGWQAPETREEVNEPVKHIIAGQKDYLIVRGREGELLITDRQGQRRITPEKRFSKSPLSTVYLNRTNSKGIFLTSDLEGRLVYLKENGRSSRVTFGQFSPLHNFLYEDITGDTHPDFIFFDRNTLYYYDRFIRLKYFYTLRHDVSSPILFETSNGLTLIGFVSTSTNEVFLFDRQGLVETAPGIRGTTPFDIGILDSPGTLSLVIGSGRFIKNFRLTKP